MKYEAILATLLAMIVGFNCWLVLEIFKVERKQAEALRYIQTIDVHNKELQDHEKRIRTIEKTICCEG